MPASIYMLTAHRLYPYLLTPETAHETPVSFVMGWRVSAVMTFADSLPILMALFGAQFGQFGISIMHFR